jgi:hypothetical protein
VIRKLGGWPVLGESSGWTADRQQSFDWLDLLIKFRQFGFSHDVLIDLSVTPDFRNNTRHIIDVSVDLARGRAPPSSDNRAASAARAPRRQLTNTHAHAHN